MEADAGQRRGRVVVLPTRRVEMVMSRLLAAECTREGEGDIESREGRLVAAGLGELGRRGRLRVLLRRPRVPQGLGVTVGRQQSSAFAPCVLAACIRRLGRWPGEKLLEVRAWAPGCYGVQVVPRFVAQAAARRVATLPWLRRKAEHRGTESRGAAHCDTKKMTAL